MLQKVNKTILLSLCSILLLTACYPNISERDLPKTCLDEKDAIATAEYWLSQQYSSLEVFKQRPYQSRKNRTGDTWLISGTLKEKEIDQRFLTTPFIAEIRVSDCKPLSLHAPWDVGE